VEYILTCPSQNLVCAFTVQALEAIKIAAGMESLPGRLLIFEAVPVRTRVVQLRGKNLSCAACGTAPKLTPESLQEASYLSTCAAPTESELQVPSVSAEVH
jgi:adenylyltransferase and sulfurtransferase